VRATLPHERSERVFSLSTPVRLDGQSQGPLRATRPAYSSKARRAASVSSRMDSSRSRSGSTGIDGLLDERIYLEEGCDWQPSVVEASYPCEKCRQVLTVAFRSEIGPSPTDESHGHGTVVTRNGHRAVHVSVAEREQQPLREMRTWIGRESLQDSGCNRRNTERKSLGFEYTTHLLDPERPCKGRDHL
jgi:hypothetical protein